MTDGEGDPLVPGEGEGLADGVAVGLGDRLAIGRGVAVTTGDSPTVGAGDADAPVLIGVALGAGLDGLGVRTEGDSDGVEVADPAPGVGKASGRIAAPMAIAAMSDGSMATATKMVERVRFMFGAR